MAKLTKSLSWITLNIERPPKSERQEMSAKVMTAQVFITGWMELVTEWINTNKRQHEFKFLHRKIVVPKWAKTIPQLAQQFQKAQLFAQNFLQNKTFNDLMKRRTANFRCLIWSNTCVESIVIHKLVWRRTSNDKHWWWLKYCFH